jgi:hypothetical protein
MQNSMFNGIDLAIINRPLDIIDINFDIDASRK